MDARHQMVNAPTHVMHDAVAAASSFLAGPADRRDVMEGEGQPSLLWFNGEVRPWHEATVHIWSELAIRGASVFEGIRAYWMPSSETYRVIALNEHVGRLRHSARLMRYPFDESIDWCAAIQELLLALDFREHVYIRPTVYIDRGRYQTEPAKMTMGAYIVAFPVPRSPQTDHGIRLASSSWRRSSDLVLPPRAKVGSAYHAFRLPLTEARSRGADDAVLLNDDGTVAETTGSAIFLVRGNRVITPPLYSGILESITRSIVLRIAAEQGYIVEERPVNRSELYVADELFICGTLVEVQPVIAIDDLTVGDGSPGMVSRALHARYLDLCEGPAPDPTLVTELPRRATA